MPNSFNATSGRVLCSVIAALAILASPGLAQQSSLVDDLLRDVGDVEEKLMSLARAMPAEAYDWRPGEGVRSVGEVFMHVAADNYLLATGVGAEAPASTGIVRADYGTAQAYERRKLDRAAVIAELEASFAHVQKAMSGSAAMLGDTIRLFGGEMTVQQLWILEATHLHEHLGQAIAYARSNGIVPPWSR